MGKSSLAGGEEDGRVKQFLMSSCDVESLLQNKNMPRGLTALRLVPDNHVCVPESKEQQEG